MGPSSGEIWWGKLVAEASRFPILVLSGTSTTDFEGLYYEETRGQLLVISGEMSQAILVEKKADCPGVRAAIQNVLFDLRPPAPPNIQRSLDDTDLFDPVDPDEEYDHVYGRHRINDDS